MKYTSKIKRSGINKCCRESIRACPKPNFAFNAAYGGFTAVSVILRLTLILSQTLDEYLVVIQKRSSLLVGWYDVLISSEANFLAKDAWNGDDQSGKEEDSHDDEGKDPLKGNGSGKELPNSESSCQDAKCEAHGIVLEDNEEEQAVNQDTPNCDIGKDARCQVMGVHSNGTIPVQGNKCPCQWPRNDWDVDESWVGIMSEV